MHGVFSAADAGAHADLVRAARESYGHATALEMRAERCRTVAESLDRRRIALIERHRPVMELHRETVWDGRAATVSRERLQRVTDVSLRALAVDLAATSRALLGEAAELTREAAAMRHRAHAAETAAARMRRRVRVSAGGPWRRG